MGLVQSHNMYLEVRCSLLCAQVRGPQRFHGGNNRENTCARLRRVFHYIFKERRRTAERTGRIGYVVSSKYQPAMTVAVQVDDFAHWPKIAARLLQKERVQHVKVNSSSIDALLSSAAAPKMRCNTALVHRMRTAVWV